MMQRDAAIVLRRMDYKESSQIVTVLTAHHGKISLIAHGVKKPRSALLGLLHPMMCLDIVFHQKAERNLQILKEASAREKWHALQIEMEKMALSMNVLELTDHLVHDNETSEEFFEFAYKFLTFLNSTTHSSLHLFPYVQYRLAALYGLQIQWSEEIGDGRQGLVLRIQDGNIGFRKGEGLELSLSELQAEYLCLGLHSKSAKLRNLNLTPFVIRELTNHLDVFLKHHVETVRKRKSASIFEQILS